MLSRESQESWENCEFSVRKDEFIELYCCKHPKMIGNRNYEHYNINGLNLVLLYPDSRFYNLEGDKHIKDFMRKMFMENKKYDYVADLEGGRMIKEIPEEQIIKRALAQCNHCKFHKIK